MGATTVLSRTDIAARILAGEHLIVYHDTLLRIPYAWLDAHPGGTLALLHFVGRDATDEIEAYHPDDTLKFVRRFAIGRVDRGTNDVWEPLVPPIMTGWVRRLNADGKPEWYREAAADSPSSSQILLVDKNLSPESHSHAPTLASLSPPPTGLSLDVQSRHSKAYRELHRRITDAGLYNTPYLTGYGPEVARYTLLAVLSVYAYKRDWMVISAFALGLLWHQLTFTAHDLGHMGVTHNWTLDRILGIVIADFIGGLSIGWWVDNHNVHHLVTNHPSHDPDIEHLPFFAISPSFLTSLWSSYYKRIMTFDTPARILISIQHNLFYLVMLFARFNLYANSYSFLFKKAFDTKRARGGRWAFIAEIVGIFVFWVCYSLVLVGCGTWKKALVYLLISHVTPSPLHIQIVLSHFSMSTEDLGPTESFPHRQLRTTTDVTCPDNLGFIHGGLHLQVTHHLFPRLPRHNLRKASLLVKQFAQEQGLTYAEFGFVEANREVLGVLKGVAEVASQLQIVGRVAKKEVSEAVMKMNGNKVKDI